MFFPGNKSWQIATLDPKGQSKGTLSRQRKRQALRLTNKMMLCKEDAQGRGRGQPITADVIQLRRIDAS